MRVIPRVNQQRPVSEIEADAARVEIPPKVESTRRPKADRYNGIYHPWFVIGVPADGIRTVSIAVQQREICSRRKFSTHALEHGGQRLRPAMGAVIDARISIPHARLSVPGHESRHHDAATVQLEPLRSPMSVFQQPAMQVPGCIGIEVIGNEGVCRLSYTHAFCAPANVRRRTRFGSDLLQGIVWI